MKGIAGHVVKNVVLVFIVATIMARHPYIVSFNIVHLAPLGARTLQVRGVVELQRDSQGRAGAENFYWFNLWWQGEEAANLVLFGVKGIDTAALDSLDLGRTKRKLGCARIRSSYHCFSISLSTMA